MRPRAAPVLLPLLLLAGCAGGTSSAEEETPHGYVEGAEETAEPQPTLVVSDASGQEAYTLDPLSEEVTPLDDVAGEVVATDGRYAYFANSDKTSVFDSGTWTVDHGDHVHYYRAESRALGELDVQVHDVTGDTGVSVLETADGAAVLDREKLDEGQLETPSEVDGASAARFDSHLLSVSRDGAIEVRDDSGDSVTTLDASCAAATGHMVTRLGTVLGCGDSAVLVRGDAESPEAEVLDYSDSGREDLGHRPTSPVVTAAGNGGVELVNFVESAVLALDVDDPVAASGTGEDSPALVLDGDGVLRAFDPESGEETTEVDLLHELDAGVSITVDSQRAYVTDPGSQAVHEIDYRDDLRVSRTFELDFTPGAMVETGW